MASIIKDLCTIINSMKNFNAKTSDCCDNKMIVSYFNTIYKVSFEKIGDSPEDEIENDMYNELINLK